MYTHSGPIDRVLSPATSAASYENVDRLDDRLPPDGAVRGYRVVGDTDGDDAGRRTGVTVDFHPIRFIERIER